MYDITQQIIGKFTWASRFSSQNMAVNHQIILVSVAMIDFYGSNRIFNFIFHDDTR